MKSLTPGDGSPPLGLPSNHYCRHASPLFFILGCQRSGTTLMRLVLESHSQIRCFDEGHAYTILGSPSLLRDVLEDRPPHQMIGFKIPRWTEQLCDSVLTDPGLDVVADNFYQEEPLIFVVRDARDTVCSMVNLKMGESNWLETWGTTILQRKIQDSGEFRREFAGDIDSINTAPGRPVAAAALFWKYKVASYYRYLDRGFPVLLVHYERLVQHRFDELKRITNFLGVDWEDAMLKHFEFQHPETDEHGLAVGGTDPSRPIHSESVGQYSSFLRPSETEDILRIAGDAMERLGYNTGGLG